MKVVPKGRPYIMIKYGFSLTYAEADAHLVLKHEVTWKKINGFVLNTKWGCYWFSFRRDWKW